MKYDGSRCKARLQQIQSCLMCRENAGGIAEGAPADSNLPIVAQPLLTSLSSVIAGGHHLGKKALDS